jgi:hypothetical protein
MVEGGGRRGGRSGEVAELLSAESGVVATDAADLDMSAAAIVGDGIYLFYNFLIVGP